MGVRAVVGALLLACVACADAPAHRPAVPSSNAEARTTPLFEFHSSPWVNFHQRLIAESDTGGAFAHEPCPCGKDRDAWSAAVAAYRTTYKDRDPTFDHELQMVNLTFALAGDAPSVSSPFLEQPAAGTLPAAFELYRRSTWAKDDADNRAWIARTEPLVARWGEGFAAELAMRFEAKWPVTPVRVEVARYATWSGAYTVPSPLIAVTVANADPSYTDEAWLEILFHEASHAFVKILQHDLETTFVARGKRMPRGLEHVIIFHTAGELTRKRLGPSYVPFADKHGLYGKGDWARLAPVVRTHWQPWLDGKTDLPTTLRNLAGAL